MKTAIVLLASEGEYDSYSEWPDTIYLVDGPKFDLTQAFSDYWVDLVNKEIPGHVRIGTSKQLFGGKDDNEIIHLWPDYNKVSAINRIKVEELQKIHTIKYYVEEVLKGEKVDYIETYNL